MGRPLIGFLKIKAFNSRCQGGRVEGVPRLDSRTAWICSQFSATSRGAFGCSWLAQRVAAGFQGMRLARADVFGDQYARYRHVKFRRFVAVIGGRVFITRHS